jgi:uncharacterized tellurite resistance protein B-like protein
VSENSIGLVKALGFVAWADQTVSPEEREMLRTVMDALAIPEERRRELCESLRSAPASIDEIAASFDDDVERRFALAQAIMLAGVDGEVSDVERERIGELATALGVDEDELGFIYEAVEATHDAFPAIFTGDVG